MKQNREPIRLTDIREILGIFADYAQRANFTERAVQLAITVAPMTGADVLLPFTLTSISYILIGWKPLMRLTSPQVS